MHRFASPLLKLSFDGPDIPSEESLHSLFRTFGHIYDIAPYPPGPVPTPPGVVRSTTITFRRIQHATVARNVMHGLMSERTRIKAAYEQPIQVHAVRNWISSHPRIVLPVIVFLLGTLTYTVSFRSCLREPETDGTYRYLTLSEHSWWRPK
jgi:hypothetical protein